ncbi:MULTISPECIES: STAS domain-containing protein [unclassified Nocardioides]|uniref:STAS domain-containing protein n=1 Tax=unclassified Nocardioides TaxID=2615069 RepID=UPI003606E9B4
MAATLSIEGELDVLSREELAWRLHDLDRVACSTVRLDVARVSYIDVRCLRLIDQARKRFTLRGQRLELSASSVCFALVARAAGYTSLAAEADQVTTVAEPTPPPVAA